MTFQTLVNTVIIDILKPFVVLIFAAAIVFFLWNVFGLVRSSDQPEEIAKFKEKIVWGIIAIAVMASMWGLVRFITGSLNLDPSIGIQVRTSY